MEDHLKNEKVATEDDWIELITIKCDDEPSVNDHQHIVNEETFDQSQLVVPGNDNDNILDNSMTTNRRVVDDITQQPNLTSTNITNGIEANLGPIFEYAAEPLLPLFKVNQHRSQFIILR
jgi:hypothetical protein